MLSSFSTLHHRSFDPGLFAQRYPPPLDLARLAEAADELGLKVERYRRSLEWVLSRRLPVALRLEPSSTAQTQATSNVGENAGPLWALVLNAHEDRVAVLTRGSASPIMMDLRELKARYRGDALSVAPKGSEAVDPDGIDLRSARFGLRWFVPELLKHKRIWRDVLCASLVLQLMGLAANELTAATEVLRKLEKTLPSYQRSADAYETPGR